MEIIHTLSPALYFAAAVLCFVTGGIMLLHSIRGQKSGAFLGISFCIIAYIHFTLYLSGSRLILLLPHLYPTTDIAALLYMPVSYMYVSITITGKKNAAGKWVHLVLPVICIIDLLPTLVLSASEKSAILSGQIFQFNMSSRMAKGWLLPDGVHTPVRIIVIFVYWVLQLRLITKRVAFLRELYKPGKGWERWILVFFTLQLVFFLPAIALLPNPGNADSFALLNIISGIGALCLAVSVLMYPKLAYGTEIINHDGYGTAKAKNRLDEELIATTSVRLTQYLQEHRPFLKQGYTIKELAEGMNMPLHLFSAFINQSLGKNFNDLMNQYRVLYCKELVQNGEAKKLNLHGLALKCGFSNRNTFTIAFKKTTGLTPSKYLELIYGYRRKVKPGARKKTRNRKRNTK